MQCTMYILYNMVLHNKMCVDKVMNYESASFRRRTCDHVIRSGFWDDMDGGTYKK